MKKKWLGKLGLVALPIALIAALDNGLPYALIDHANRPVASRSQVWKASTIEDLNFKSTDGIALSGWWVPKFGSKQTVILLHTLGGNREDLLEFAQPLWEAGFNLVMLDLRSHGMSDGKYFTYGFHEWNDITAAIDTVIPKESDQQFSILGVSAGGTVAISAAARDQRIRKVVTIGTFADLGETIGQQTGWLPEPWRKRAIGRSEELANFKVSESSARRWMAQIAVPVMVAHGDRDSYIPIQNGEQLSGAAKEPKVFYKIEGASHETMLQSKPLQQAVIQFLWNKSQ